MGPASSVVEDDLAEWRRKYSLPYFVDLRVPTLEERASSYILGEIAVYKAFFDTGIWGVIPVLVVGLCTLFEISPSQLNPPTWRILIAIQNLGDLEYLSFGINEVLSTYHLAALNGGEGRFHLRPRSGLLIMEELPKGDQKGPVFNKKWQERYPFITFPGSLYRWNYIGKRRLQLSFIVRCPFLILMFFFAAGTHPAPSEGESTVFRARQLPLDCRQVNFLVSETVLDNRVLAGNMAEDPFLAYQEAAKVVSAKKGSAS
ncbi:hypothetical protein Bca4012_083783 [Brassica carinata]